MRYRFVHLSLRFITTSTAPFLLAACIGGQRAESGDAGLPEECEAFVAEYGQCLSKGGPQLAVTSAARAEQTRRALIAESERGAEAVPALRAKCTQGRERLSTTCR